MFVRIVCDRCLDHGDGKVRTLTRVFEDGSPLTAMTVEYDASDDRQWEAPLARLSSEARSHQLARRSDDGTAWLVACSVARGCQSVYEVADDELHRAVELGRARSDNAVRATEVGRRLD